VCFFFFLTLEFSAADGTNFSDSFLLLIRQIRQFPEAGSKQAADKIATTAAAGIRYLFQKGEISFRKANAEAFGQIIQVVLDHALHDASGDMLAFCPRNASLNLILNLDWL
jgi:hypothetical protein